MNRDQAVKGYDLVCAMRNHEYVAGKLRQDRAILSDAPASGDTFYEINKAQYPKELALKIVNMLIEYHEKAVDSLVEELAAL